MSTGLLKVVSVDVTVRSAVELPGTFSTVETPPTSLREPLDVVPAETESMISPLTVPGPLAIVMEPVGPDELPVLNSMAPLLSVSTLDDTDAVATVTAPELAPEADDPPLVTVTEPPAVAAVAAPALSTTFPPPRLPEPATAEILPPTPVVAAPADNNTDPVFPVAAVPVMRTMAPD
jgi:hypothetical protein